MANVTEAEGSSANVPKSDPQSTKVCCHGTEGGRNLVINLDGTGNQFGDKNTNVVEMYSLIDKGEESNQLSLYYSGIGTYARPSWTSFSYYKQVLYHKIDLAIAWEFEKTIMGAYSWLSDNYRDGDRIFLLGFSRGAFQVRALSAMIDKVGLLYKGNSMQIPFAYELYADPLSGVEQVNAVGTSDRDAQKMSKADRFKSAFCHKNVKVHFVGAWDTVSSIGLIRKKKLLPGTIDGMKHVCFFRHALALDERRVKFLPEYAYGGTTLPPKHTDPKPPLNVEEDHTTAWSLLYTSVFAIVSHFVAPTSFGLISVASRLISLYVTFLFSTFFQDAVVPSLHKGSLSKGLKSTTRNPDPIMQKINEDISVMEGEDKKVDTPQCLEVWFAGTHSDIGGGNVQNMGMDRSRPPLRWMVHEAGALGLRMKPFTRELSSEEHIEIKESLTGLWKFLEWLPFRRLTFDTETAEGSETYRTHHGAGRVIQPGQKLHGSLTLANKLGKSDGYIPKARLSRMLLSEIKKHKANSDEDFWGSLGEESFRDWLEVSVVPARLGLEAAASARLLAARAYQITGPGYRLKCQPGSARLQLRLQPDRRCSQACANTVRKVVLQAISCEETFSISFSADGKWLASGHVDGTVCIRDLRSGSEIGQSLGQHYRRVMSVAFSPDSKRLVSASWDCTINLWDIEKMEQVGNPWEGHAPYHVNCAVFSPDGTKVVSASDDKTLRVWDPYTGKEMAVLEGHGNWVRSVAFSPDAKHIVSGSDDQTVRIWDVHTYQQDGEALKGHTDWVQSVAYHPDRKRIASGSDDKTIRIWNAETRKQVSKPLRGHSIHSVCFSPDGKLLASGSLDRTIRIWNADTGEQIGHGLRGHNDWVSSVAFSPDGKKLASVSHDSTIKIWDVEIYVMFSSLSRN
ncbi:hypothetical protein D9613_012540 [Agrocybe pediades]|uniref:T6SS Phospholipase effector Tle1-like catalytic domain-containing protein n=1 Tax=Agrocybe pediades TaxID=84607 RepID=A0A8H4VPT7_9AGAR|nr:hypothetical protein D9613_012540 [Agrocybe pediades]